MRFRIQLSIILLILCGVFGRRDLPNDLKDKLNKYNFSISENDCMNISDSRVPFAKCDSISGNEMGTNLTESLINYIKDAFFSKDSNTLFDKLNDLCKLGKLNKDCIDELDKKCKKYKHVDSYIRRQLQGNPLFSSMKDLCDPKGELKNKYTNTKNNVNLATCFSDQKVLDLLNRPFEMIIKSIQKVKNILDEKEPPEISGRSKPTDQGATGPNITLRTPDDEKKVERLCDVYKDFMLAVNYAIIKCHDQTRQLFVKMVQLIMPPELHDKCKLPEDDPSKMYKEFKGDDKKRETTFIFGNFNKASINQTTIETCNFTNGEIITLIELPQFKLDCMLADLNANFSYLKDCNLTIFDKERNEIDMLEFQSRLQSLPKKFKMSDSMKLNKDNSKGKGKPDKDITLTNDGDKMQYIDGNVGIAIRSFLFKTIHNVVIFNFALRMPQAAYDVSSGILTRSCIDEIKRRPASSGTRRKRVASNQFSEAASSDASAFQDQNAASMANTMQAEINTINGLDSAVFSASGSLPRLILKVYMFILPIITAVVFI